MAVRHRCTWLGLLPLTGIVSAAIAAPALAQAGSPGTAGGAYPTPEQPAAEEIVVTASRAAPAGFAAPTPTTVIGAEQIERQNTTSIGTLLNQVPAFKGSLNPSSNGAKTQQAGASLADLRGLGPQRTLVLIDGMRVVPNAPVNTTGVSISPDMNQVPTLMIERVDVVTGGASAQWGSDAISGVINIILKNKFEGFEAKVQGGISQLGDAGEARVGLLYGRAFAEGRGHLVLGLDAVKNYGIGDMYTRDWGRDEWQIVTNSAFATNGLPANVLARAGHTSLSLGGVIAGPATFSLRGYEFLPGGTTLAPFQYGSLVGGVLMIGGQGKSFTERASLMPAVKRLDPYLHAEYDLTDGITAFVEGSYALSRADIAAATSRDTGIVIRKDNAFLPASVVAAMTTANITSFTLNRINFDIHQAHAQVTNKTPHGALGLRGTFGGSWHWDMHAAFGRNTYTNLVTSTRNKANFAFATDAVVNNGQIVCRATIPGTSFNAAAAGCVPINLFGAGSPSAAAIAYSVGQARTRSVYDQTSAAANVRGEPFSTWAAPVSIAAGVEYRREKQRATADALAAAGAFDVGNGGVFSGAFDVKEGYIEAIVPLARDFVLARSLDLNGAVRVADYSSVGSQTTWKGGATWEPVAGLRFRATRSRDIRAPALYELFGPGSATVNTINVRGFSANVPVNITLGDPNLKPERSDTTTLGVVLEPRGIRGLQASVDYYDIDIRDAIAAPSTATIGNLCTLGQTAFCNLITFNPTTGAPTAVTASVRNAAGYRSKGIDFALTYRRPLADIVGGDTTGTIAFNLSGTYTTHMYIDLGSGSGPIDRAGENSQFNFGAVPRVRLNGQLALDVGRLSATLQSIFTSRGKIDNTYNLTPATTININRVPAIVYFNLFGTYRLSDRLQVFASVNNLLDKDPPPVPYAAIFAPTNGAYYDTVGRAFQLGATLRF